MFASNKRGATREWDNGFVGGHWLGSHSSCTLGKIEMKIHIFYLYTYSKNVYTQEISSCNTVGESGVNVDI